MADTLIQIKRAITATAPGSLSNGELAYSGNTQSDSLFIGNPNGGAVTRIGGAKYSFLHQAGAPGTLNANSVPIVNSTFGIDQLTIGAFTTVTSVNVGANVQLTTVQLFLGNTTVNTVINSIGAVFSGNASVNATNIQIGNTTVNTQVNSSVISTGTANFRTAANVGANVNLDTVRLSIGNTTVNAVVNSVALVMSGNATVNATHIQIGNSTVNAVINSSAYTLNGVNAALVTNRDSVANNNTLIGTRGRINFIQGTNITLAISDDSGGGQVNVQISASGAGTPAGLDTQIQFNDGGSSFGADANLRFNKTSGLLTVGNTTVNTQVNSTVIVVGTTNMSVAANVGANVNIDTVRLNIGNTTVNAVLNSVALVMSGNASVNSTVIRVGNTTVNTQINSSSIFTSGTLQVEGVATFNGDVNINGTLTSIDATNITVNDSIISLARNNGADTLDIGFYGQYNDGTERFTGLIWDTSADVYELFANTTAEPTTTLNTGGTGYTRATLKSFLDTGALISNSTAVTLLANSTVAVNMTANTLSLTTALPVGSGGTGRSTLTNTAVLIGNTTGPLTMVSSTTEGHVLQIVSNLPTFGMLDGGTF